MSNLKSGMVGLSFIIGIFLFVTMIHQSANIDADRIAQLFQKASLYYTKSNTREDIPVVVMEEPVKEKNAKILIMAYPR
jgi:hypothetical protein